LRTYRNMQRKKWPTMRRREAAAALSLVWLAGCAASALDMAPERPDRPWVPATTESGEIIAGGPRGRPGQKVMSCPPVRSSDRFRYPPASIPPGSIRFPR